MTLTMNPRNFQQKNGYVINDQNNTEYGKGNENDSSFKLETKVIKSSLCDNSDAYIHVTGDITATGGDANTRVEFKNRAPFLRCVTHINDEHIDTAENIDIIMPMYNLIEYSDNYSDTSGGLWQFKRDKSYINNAGSLANVTTLNSTSFKYKSSFLRESTAVGNDGVFKGVKINVPLKYLSNFWRSLEIPLINCKSHLELNWTENCVMPDNDDETTSKITNRKLYIPVVTLSTKYNVNLTKQLS